MRRSSVLLPEGSEGLPVFIGHKKTHSTAVECVLGNQESPHWRRDRDSNPGGSLTHLHDFQSCSFGHSDIAPCLPIAGKTRNLAEFKCGVFNVNHAQPPMHKKRPESRGLRVAHRAAQIRTGGLLNPIQARCQTALQPV